MLLAGILNYLQLVLYGTVEQPINLLEKPRTPPRAGFNFTRFFETPETPEAPEATSSSEMSSGEVPSSTDNEVSALILRTGSSNIVSCVNLEIKLCKNPNSLFLNCGSGIEQYLEQDLDYLQSLQEVGSLEVTLKPLNMGDVCNKAIQPDHMAVCG